MTIVIFEETDDVYEAKDFIKVMNFIFFFGRLLLKTTPLENFGFNTTTALDHGSFYWNTSQ